MAKLLVGAQVPRWCEIGHARDSVLTEDWYVVSKLLSSQRLFRLQFLSYNPDSLTELPMAYRSGLI